MKVILRGNLIDISLIYSITEITNYNNDIRDTYFSYAENPSFQINFIGENSLIIEEKWLKVSTNNNSSYNPMYGLFVTEFEFPKWKESYEKLKKTRDELVRLWLDNQTEIPIIK
jgi:hypothetical protein